MALANDPSRHQLEGLTRGQKKCKKYEPTQVLTILACIMQLGTTTARQMFLRIECRHYKILLGNSSA